MVVLLAQIGWHSLQDLLRRPPHTIRVDTRFVLLNTLVENKKCAPTVDRFSANDFQLAEAEFHKRSVLSP